MLHRLPPFPQTRWSPRLVALAASFALVAGFAGPVSASDKTLHKLELVKPPKDAEGPAEPVYRAKIDYPVPGLSAEKFVLKDFMSKPPVEAPASKVTPYPESDEPLGLVVLIQGDVEWMGNDTYTDADSPDILQGAYSGLPGALDTLAKAGPEGSMGALLVFREGDVDSWQVGELSALSSSLKSQRDYNKPGSPLVVGLDRSIEALSGMSGRQVLVVFAEGVGQTENIKPMVEERVTKLKAMGAEVFTVHFAATPDDNQVPKSLMRSLGYSGAYEAPLRDNFESKAADVVSRLAGRYFVEFPAAPFATKDEKPRELSVVIGKDELSAGSVASVKFKAPDEGGSLWWLWMILGIILLVLVVVVISKIAGREKPLPPPVVEEPAAPSPQKTVMLNVGGNTDGFPVVGWIVPITGPDQYQTFKLLPGKTLVGTGGEAHIVVNDSFMSTSHAEIVCTPQGFTLTDLGSTNGTFVNDQPVSTHELFDNDVFRLGKTDFKFKSTH